MNFFLKNKFLIYLLILPIMIISGLIYEFLNKVEKTPQRNKKISQSFKITSTSFNQLPFMTNCPVFQRHEASFEGELVAHEDFVNKFNLRVQPELAVQEQLKYLNGYFHYAPDEYRGLPEMPFDIQVTQMRETPYDGEGKKGLNIKYQANFNLTLCQEIDYNNFEIILPRDPYLAYWEVAPELRLKITNHGLSEIANPCIADRYAVLKYPPHYWYTYQPRRVHENPKFDCKAYLTSKKKVYSFRPQLKSKDLDETKFSFEELERLPKLRSSFIFSIISPQDGFQTELEKIKSYFSENADFLKYTEDKKNLHKHLSGLSKKYDPSLYAFLNFLQEVRNLMQLNLSQIKMRPEDVIIDIDGVVKGIEKPITLTFYIGANAGHTPNESYWKYIKTSLEESDFIFYVSHSGHGENMKLSTLMEKLKLSKKDLLSSLGKKKYQFLGILSCFSTSFHGQEIEQYLPPGKTLDLMLMGSDGYNFLAPLIPLTKLAKKDPSRPLALLGKDNIILIKRGKRYVVPKKVRGT